MRHPACQPCAETELVDRMTPLGARRALSSSSRYWCIFQYLQPWTHVPQNAGSVGFSARVLG
jgi:hypothetical protein